jgi:predicted TIM-barrel fold metal-dependent hydrolase
MCAQAADVNGDGLPAPETSSKDANKAVSEYVGHYKTRMVGFAVLNPLTDRVSAKVLHYLRRDLGLQGIVVFCPDFNCHPANSRAMRLYEAAEELKMPVFFHNGAPLTPNAVMDFAQPYLLDEIARTFPKLKIIIGSMGAPFIEQTMCMLNKHENVYADLAMNPRRTWRMYNTIIEASEREVMGKLLFGSGYPQCQPENYIENLLGFNRLLGDSGLPTVPRESIREIVERDILSLLGVTVEKGAQTNEADYL